MKKKDKRMYLSVEEGQEEMKREKKVEEERAREGSRRRGIGKRGKLREKE